MGNGNGRDLSEILKALADIQAVVVKQSADITALKGSKVIKAEAKASLLIRTMTNDQVTMEKTAKGLRRFNKHWSSKAKAKASGEYRSEKNPEKTYLVRTTLSKTGNVFVEYFG